MHALPNKSPTLDSFVEEKGKKKKRRTQNKTAWLGQKEEAKHELLCGLCLVCRYNN